jgi:hypothetical protein
MKKAIVLLLYLDLKLFKSYFECCNELRLQAVTEHYLSFDKCKLNHPLYREPSNLYLLKTRFSSLYRLPVWLSKLVLRNMDYELSELGFNLHRLDISIA